MPATTETLKRVPKPQRRGSSRNASSNNVANPKLVLTQKEITSYVNQLPPHLKELDKLRGKRNGSVQVNTVCNITESPNVANGFGQFRPRLFTRAQIHPQRPTHGP